MKAAPAPLRRMFGGLRLPRRAPDETLRRIALPPELILPLDPFGRGEAIPLVQPGDAVRRGQTLARASLAGALPVHAPTSGVIVAVEARPVAMPSGGHRARGAPGVRRCIVIAADGADRALDAPEWPRCDDPASLTFELLRARLAQAGIAGFGGAGFPAHAKLRGGVHTVIANGCECEPPIGCDDALLRDPLRAARVVAGLRAVRAALGATRGILALEADAPQAIEQLRAASAGIAGIELAVLPARYPQGDARQLIRSLTGMEVPGDGVALDIGVACFNVATLAAIDVALREAQPPLSRIVTVTAPDGRSVNAEVRLGTPWHWLLRELGVPLPHAAELFQGGSMMGVPVADAAVPVTLATNSIRIERPASTRTPLPCIRCGDCAPVCPVRLQPQLLWHAARADDEAGLDALRLTDCIECGCCDTVCPSHIPLAQRFGAEKRRLASERETRRRADAARARHLAREQRLQQQAAEQAAARERKKAELAARRERPSAADDDPVAAALAKARARKAASRPDPDAP